MHCQHLDGGPAPPPTQTAGEGERDWDRGGGSYYIIGISAGLAQLSQDTSILGFFWEAREDPPKNNF